MTKRQQVKSGTVMLTVSGPPDIFQKYSCFKYCKLARNKWWEVFDYNCVMTTHKVIDQKNTITIRKATPQEIQLYRSPERIKVKL